MSRPIRETGLRYSKKPDVEGSKSYREIAEEVGISYVSVANYLNSAFIKIATEVFVAMNGRRPTKNEAVEIARNEDFQQLVAQALREKNRK